jgi:hypothetical protein
MKTLRGVIVLVLALVLPGPVLAADFQAGLEAFERDDYATALKELRPLAEQGNAEAQVLLGRMYVLGWDVFRDYDEAAKWYRLAAEQGHTGAQLWLGNMYRTQDRHCHVNRIRSEIEVTRRLSKCAFSMA